MHNLILDYTIFLTHTHVYSIATESDYEHKQSKLVLHFNKENLNIFTNYINNKDKFDMIIKAPQIIYKGYFWKHYNQISKFKHKIIENVNHEDSYSLYLYYCVNKKITLYFDPIENPERLEQYKLELI